MTRYIMRTMIAVGALAISTLAAHAFAPEDELQQRDFSTEEAALALRTGAFAGFRPFIAEVRESKGATHGGTWFLTLYYDGFAQAVAEAESDGDVDELMANAKAFAALKPDAPEATLTIATVALARAFRDGTPGGQGATPAKASRESLEAVRKLLEDAKATASADPHWYTLMAKIAVAEGWSRDDLTALVTEAARRYPDYAPPYLVGAEAIFTTPDVNKEDLEAYARRIVEITRPTVGMSAYANIYLHAVEGLYGTGFLKATAVQWPDLKVGIKDVLSRLKYSPWLQSYFGMMACVAGDRDEAKEMISPLIEQGNAPEDYIWGSAEVFEACRSWTDGKDLQERPFQPNPWADIRPGSRLLTFDVSKRLTTAFETTVRSRLQGEWTLPFWNQEFDILEALAERYRSKRERTPAGVWKLAKFYDGFADSVDAQVGKEQNDEVLRHTDAYLAAFPKSPTAVLVKAIIMNKLAWMVRGDGSIDTVTPYQWRAFKEQIAKTRAFLEDHKAIASQDPQYYAVLLNVAAAQQWPRSETAATALEGLAKFPGYDNIETAIIHFSMPMWGIDATTLDGFIRDAVQTVPDDERDEAYATLYQMARNDQYQDELFVASLAEWDRMKRGFRELIAKYPNNWNRSAYAYNACLAGDAAAAKEAWSAIAKTGDQSMKPWWPDAKWTSCHQLADSAPPGRSPSGRKIPVEQPEH